MPKTTISKANIKDALEFEEYYQLCSDLSQQGSSSSFKDDPKYVLFTKLNFVRMKRLYKTVKINETLKNKIKQINIPMIWVVISECWCGDAAQNLPVIYAASLLNNKIKLRIILRDSNPEIMENYLTNGSKSIPKWIAINENNFEEIFVWGPRPEKLQNYMEQIKDLDFEEKIKNIQLWYNDDETKSMQTELEILIDEISIS